MITFAHITGLEAASLAAVFLAGAMCGAVIVLRALGTRERRRSR